MTAELGNDDVLVITRKRVFNRYENKYLLDDIDPKWQRVRHISLPSTVMSVLLLAGSLGLGLYGWTFHPPAEAGGYLFMALGLFLIFIIAAVKAIQSRVNVVTFNHRAGGHLFTLFGHKPSYEEVEQFCRALSERIERIRYHGEISRERMAQLLARHVEFLGEHGVLNEQDIAAAMKRIENKASGTVVKLVDERNG